MSLPFSQTLGNIAQATLADSDPRPFCRVGASAQGARSVWYAITPSVETFVNIEASGYDAMMAVYTGAPGGFLQVAGACNDDGLASFASRLVGVRLQAGIAYSIYVAQFDGATTPAALSFQVSAPAPYVVSQFADRAGSACVAGNCSLREAVSASNANPAAIVLAAGTYTLSLPGAGEDLNATGDLDVRDGLALYGQGVGLTVISAAAAGDRVLQLDPAATTGRGYTFLLRGLTLADGNSPVDGGGIAPNTAAVANSNDYLAMERVALRNNRAAGLGGGIRFNGYLEVESSVIELNEANGNGGGIALVGSTNTRVEIRQATLAENLSRASGGGIHSTSGTTTVVSSTLSGNRANGGGGAVFSAIAAPAAGLLLRYSTLANNQADADSNDLSEGGGLRLEGGAGGSLIGNLLSDNRLDGAAGPLNDCAIAPSAGVPVTASNFVRSVGSCEFNSSGDIVNLDPRLGPLANNPGGQRTHLPAFGSPALDGLAAGCPLLDQRGLVRPLDGNADQDADCDFGAAESDVLFADGFPVL